MPYQDTTLTPKQVAGNAAEAMASAYLERDVAREIFGGPRSVVASGPNNRGARAVKTKGGYKVYYSPDGRTVMTMSLSERLANIFDAANLRGEQKVVSVGKDPMGFAFTADGKKALVANHGDGSVSVIDIEKAQVVNNFHAGTGIETLTYY